MRFLSFFTTFFLVSFIGVTFWFLHLTDYSSKTWELSLPAIGAILFSVFLFVKFLLKSRDKKNKTQLIDGVEILLPAFGVMIFTAFLFAKSLASIKEEKITVVGYVNSIFTNSGDIVAYPSLVDSLNPSISEHTFYVDYGFMSTYLKNYFTSKYDDQDIIDTVEFVFLDKLLRGWVVPKENKLSSKEITSLEIQQKIVENKLFDVTTKDVQFANKKIGFQQRLNTFKDEFLYSENKKLKSIFLPSQTTLTYSRDAIRRTITFENNVVKYNFSIVDGGINNFRPENNAFHQYLARLAGTDTPRHSEHMKMKKTLIIFNYEFKKYSSLRDDYEDYQSLMKKIGENLEKQFFWEPLKKVLESEYLLER